MPDKGCEVCGGHVRPMDDQNVFGYCENCGLVYAIRDRLKDMQEAEAPRGLEASIGESRGTKELEAVSEAVDAGASSSSGSRWICPDCGTEIHLDNVSDLEFVKREHIREYHPNR